MSKINDLSGQMLVTDFDGTLFQTDKKITQKDLLILEKLGNKGIVRVIATGRSYFSIRKVIPENFPIDYIILSSGAGVMDWKRKSLINAYSIEGSLVDEIIKILKELDQPFFVHDPIPDNHYFYYYLNNRIKADFHRRLKIYRDFAGLLDHRKPDRPACQFLLIDSDLNKIRQSLVRYLEKINLIRATSPLDGKSLWVEIFDRRVSKAKAAAWLCDYLKIAPEKTIAVGNDYNDLDLLRWAGQSYAVSAAPEIVKKAARVITNSNHSLLSAIFGDI